MSGSSEQFGHPVCLVEHNISDLPTEILIHIFSHLNIQDLVACIETCKHWKEIIEDNESVWRLQCLTLKNSLHNILEDRNRGLSWKRAFHQNYGPNGVKRLWHLGKFSNPGSFNDIPPISFCNLDALTWGEIFQEELHRK